MNNALPTIPEDQTPETGSSVDDNVLPGAPIADIRDQLESGETLSDNSEEMNSITPVVENPPFIAPIQTDAFMKEKKIPNELDKVINFRKTIKHKKRPAYEMLSDSEKAEAKKKIVTNFIHVLRASTHKSTYNAHKKSIVKLRHTLNKHLDYIETKKRVKSVKSVKKSSNNISNINKSKVKL